MTTYFRTVQYTRTTTIYVYSSESTKCTTVLPGVLQTSCSFFFFPPTCKNHLPLWNDLKFDPIYHNKLDIKSFENCFRVGAAHTVFLLDVRFSSTTQSIHEYHISIRVQHFISKLNSNHIFYMCAYPYTHFNYIIFLVANDLLEYDVFGKNNVFIKCNHIKCYEFIITLYLIVITAVVGRYLFVFTDR